METTVNYGKHRIKYERHRFGGVPHTLASIEVDGRWQSLGDPVEGTKWTKDHLHRAIERTLGRQVPEAVEEGRDEVELAVRGFLRSQGLAGDGLIFKTPEEWRAEGQAYGRDEMLAAVHIEENPLYDVVNGTRPDAAALVSRFEEYLAAAGLKYEPMKAWAIAIYVA